MKFCCNRQDSTFFSRGLIMVKISIIIPVYNGINFIDKSYESITKQTMNDLEVIYVDDGSYDGSIKKLEQLANNTDFVKLHCQENTGPANARNYGIKHSSGEYIAFLDVDDIYLDKTSLESMYNLAKKENANIVCANLKKVNPKMEIEESIDSTKSRYTYFTQKTVLKPEEYGIPWAFYKNIYKRTFLEEYNIEFPLLRIGEDPLFLTQALSNTTKIHTINKDFYGYNHSINGGLNIKINTYDKKKDYIYHYIKMFDLLEKNNFNHILEDYKMEFMDYLTFRENLFDEDIHKLVKFFFNDDIYFKKGDYGYVIIDLLRKPVKSSENIENIRKVHEYIFKEVLIEGHNIDVYRLRKYLKLDNLLESEDLEKVSLSELKRVDVKTFNSLRKNLHLVGKFKKGIAHLIKNNNDILTSKSWTFTRVLRSLKSQYK